MLSILTPNQISSLSTSSHLPHLLLSHTQTPHLSLALLSLSTKWQVFSIKHPSFWDAPLLKTVHISLSINPHSLPAHRTLKGSPHPAPPRRFSSSSHSWLQPGPPSLMSLAKLSSALRPLYIWLPLPESFFPSFFTWLTAPYPLELSLRNNSAGQWKGHPKGR